MRISWRVTLQHKMQLSKNEPLCPKFLIESISLSLKLIVYIYLLLFFISSNLILFFIIIIRFLSEKNWVKDPIIILLKFGRGGTIIYLFLKKFSQFSSILKF